MESIHNLFFFFFVTSFVIIIGFFKFSNKRRPKLPPGPWKLPVLGSIHHLLGPQLPHRRFQELSKTYGPLMHLKLGEVSMVVASSPEAAREVMKTHDVTFATRPLFPAIKVLSYNGKTLSFGPYGEYWRQLRKICIMELLSAKRVHSFRHIREEEVHNLIQSISINSGRDSMINLSKMLVQMANNITMRVVIGEKFKDQDSYIELLYESIKIVLGLDLTDLFPSISWLVNLVSRSRAKVWRCHRQHDRLNESIINEHRQRRKMKVSNSSSVCDEQVVEDLVDVLLNIQEEGDLQFELTDVCIKSLMQDLFAAGSETSSSTLLWAMSELIRNPRVLRKGQLLVRDALRGKAKVTEEDIKELNYLLLIIKETLRLHPPVPLLLPRECQKKCELLGFEIPEMTRVFINVWAIGRDPLYWEDAGEFKPERFEESSIDFKGTNFELLPFGAGRRMCPGILFGLAAMELPLAQLLYYFDWELPTDSEIKSRSLDMSETFGATARKSFDLLLHAIPHDVSHHVMYC